MRVGKRDVTETFTGIAVATVVSFVALGGAVVLRLLFDRFSIGEGAALAASVTLAGIAWKGSPRTAASAGVEVAVVLGVMVALGCAWSVAQPLVVTHGRCGTGDIGLPFLLAVIGCIGAVLASPVALFGRFVPRAALIAAVALTLACAVVAALGGRSLAKPEPDAYMRLFDMASIDPGEKTTVAGKSVVYDATPQSAPLLGDRKCMLAVGESHAAVEAFDSCPTIILAHDPRTNLFLVLRDVSSQPIAIVGADEGRAADVLGVQDFRGRLGAPRAWVFGALGGLAIALLSLVMAMRSLGRARKANEAIETVHTGGGWVTIDGVPRNVSDLASHEPGPVVIVAHDASRSPTYRDDGAAKIFKAVVGNRATLREEAHARVAAWACVAIASVVTTSAPLWVSRLFGIL